MLKFNKNLQNTCNTMEEVSIIPGACCCCCSCCCCVSVSTGSGDASSSATTPGK